METKARQDAQKEREALIAREQKRKREEEQRKQMEVERKKLVEKREREAKEREKYGMDVVKFRNATQKVCAVTSLCAYLVLTSASPGNQPGWRQYKGEEEVEVEGERA